MKYPIGIQTFSQLIEEGYVYVDKTDLIYSLANDAKIYFFSRPRRFGKSLTLSTLEAYFKGRKDLFRGLKIEALEHDWKEYPVFRIDFNGTDFSQPGKLEQRLQSYLAEWEKQYDLDTDAHNEDWGFRCKRIFQRASEQSGANVVVLIDEYDKPLLDIIEGDSELLERNRQTLKAFYSIFKFADEYLRFVMLTGVTKFSQISVFSGFNQPRDISMSPHYDTLCGITEEELANYFDESISKMANTLHFSKEDMKEKLKRQYDGYHFSQRLVDVYNPYSLLSALSDQRISNFWFRTGTPSYLIRLLQHFNEQIDELTGKYYTEEDFIDYHADTSRPLPMIYQSGYLTIKKYDPEFNEFLIDFPNAEVQKGLLTILANHYLEGNETADNLTKSLASHLKRGNLDKFRSQLTAFLASIPYSMRRKGNERERERYFHYTFYLILRLMSNYTIYTEKEQSQGRVDCIIETPQYVYLFEFKLDGTASEALQQIEAKGYARPYADDARQLFHIGVNFSSETGTINDWQVRKD